MQSLLILSLLLLISSCLSAPAPSITRTRAPICALDGISQAELVKKGDTANAYELSFTWRTDLPVDYVDYHYRINQERFVNIRAYDGSTPAHQATSPLTLKPGDVLHAMLTYSVNGVGCDVAISHTTAPSIRSQAPPTQAETSSHIPIIPPTAQAIATRTATLKCDHIIQQLVHDRTMNGYDIYATMIPHATWIEAHYTINNVQTNMRMVPTTTQGVMALPQPINVAVGTPISYFFTFGSPNAQACDSGVYETGDVTPQIATPTPVMTTPRTSAVTPAQLAAAPVSPVPAQQAAPATQPAAAAATTPVQTQIPIIPLAAPAASAPATPATPAAATPAVPATAPAAATAAAAIPAETSPEAAAEPPCAAGNIIHQVASDNEHNYVITFNTAPGDTPFDSVEIYTLVGNDEKTVPMGTNVATGQTPPIHVAEGESLIYYITYSRAGGECKTAFFST